MMHLVTTSVLLRELHLKTSPEEPGAVHFALHAGIRARGARGERAASRSLPTATAAWQVIVGIAV